MVLSQLRGRRARRAPRSLTRDLPFSARRVTCSLTRGLPSRARRAPRASALVALAFLAAGCEQSLFDAGGGKQEPDLLGATCPADCLADASRDFNGTAGGKDGTWRYLDDHRDRTWAPMTASDGKLVGAEAGLTISVCDKASTAPSCVALPGALLVSTTGATSSADPALEFTATDKRAVQISTKVYVPENSVMQQLLIYRNSREDLLYAGPAVPGVTLEPSIDVDVIPGDRLLVALAPASGGAADIGLEVFLSDVGKPSKCQVALDFTTAAGTTAPNYCGMAFTSRDYDNGDVEIAPTLGDGPFPELGTAAVITPGKYYKGVELLDKSGDVTIQFWMKLLTIDNTYPGYPFSDHDLDSGGGVNIDVYDRGGTITLESLSPVRNGPPYIGGDAPLPNYGTWTFVRTVHTQGMVSVCLNGKRVISYDAPAGRLNSAFPPHLGKNVRWSPVAVVNGSMDDVRVVSAALPCE